ncbi:MAG: T9SS type A sorting domain-containing protein, partial [Bacteroidales bacterium]|nr:T9SS type A sorting domain-containing protein [Bacteroidales bacterium]
LNLAPAEGPYNYGDSIFPNWEWSSTSRTIQPGRRGETNNGFPGNYDGLDYMLYYNMYTLLFSGPVSVNEPYGISFQAYPNPFKDIIHVKAHDFEGPVSYELISIDGKMIRSGTFTEHISINSGDIREGVYILRISSNNNTGIVRKLIKHNF